MITPEQLVKIAPYSKRYVTAFTAPLNVAMCEFEVTTKLRVCAFLSQILEESEELRYVKEIASGAAYDERADLGNTKPDAIAIAKAAGVSTGRFYKGRGLIQLTGYNNMVACGDALGIDLVHNPELLERPTNACRSAGWYWARNNINKYADLGDIDGVSDVVNKGRKTQANGDANGFARRTNYYALALRVCDD